MKKLILIIVATLIPVICNAAEKKFVEKELTKQEKIFISNAVTKGFKDPDSAKFKWVKTNNIWGVIDKSYYCGLVNGKNSYGAYVGFKPFFVNVIFKNKKIIDVIPDYINDTEEDVLSACKLLTYSDLSDAK